MVTRDAVLAKAQGWVGMLERTGNNDIWFNDDWGMGSGPDAAWCFCFVQSCFHYADPSPSGALPHQSMYCPYGVQWARDNGQSVEVGDAPIPGDIVFFTWGNGWGRWTPGTGDHVGIVESWDGGDTIHTIEGNVGPSESQRNPQGVHRRTRSISGTVVCFWRPAVYPDSPRAIQEDDMFQDPDRAALNGVSSTVAGLSDAVRTLYLVLGAEGSVTDDEKRDKLLRRFHEVVRREVQSINVQPGQPGEPGEPGEPVNVSAVLAQASAEQLAEVGTGKLFAALGLAMQAQQARPPVTPPAG